MWYLTIDRTIQHIAQKALEAAVLEYAAKSGMAVVMKPSTGEVLALAHHPFFNPNNYREFHEMPGGTEPSRIPFEPGSTMKMFSVAAAIDSGICSPSTIFFCENGEYRIGRNIVHDTKSHGWLSLQQIVKYSSNIGSVKISEKLGPGRLYGYLKAFGFGSRTGIPCPGETSGSLSNFKRWTALIRGRSLSDRGYRFPPSS
jgi:cell division protein FtsI (penicillin-binding protein 3)